MQFLRMPIFQGIQKAFVIKSSNYQHFFALFVIFFDF